MLEYGWQIFCLSLVLSTLFNYTLRYFAPTLGLFDQADGHRRLTAGVIPRAGGLAIFIGLTGATISLLIWSGMAKSRFLDNPLSFLVLASASFGITLLGFLDDRFNLRGRNKFLGQFLIVLILVYFGNYRVERIQLFNMDFDLGPLEIPFAIFWFMGAINAANLLDGMDGLLASVGLVASVGMGGIAFIHGQILPCYISMMLAGSLLGFLYFNRPPASIYLGDAGSMLIGLLLAAISLKIHDLSNDKSWVMAIPLAVLVLPIIDTSAAILRRKLTGRSIYSTDHGHLHHCLQREGFGRKGSLFIVISLSAIAVGSAFISNLFNIELFAWGGIGLVGLILVQAGWFGRPEIRLLFKRLRNFLRISPRQKSVRGFSNEGILLHGNDFWHTVWKRVVNYAKEHKYIYVDLNINAPAFHESYHAQWTNSSTKSKEEADQTASFQHPIFVDDNCVGRLGIVMGKGNWDKRGDLGHLVKLVDIVEESARYILINPNGNAAEVVEKNVSCDIGATEYPRIR